jgi:two-component system OmpR family sensor kinase
VTLRLRVMSGLVAVATVVVVAFGLVVVRQRSVLVKQLDERLTAVEENLAQAAEFFETVDESVAAGVTGPPTGELYVAIHSSDSVLQQLARPASDPAFAPAFDIELLSSRQSLSEPFTVDAVGGGGARMVASDLGAGRWAVAALSTQAVEDAQRELLLTAGVVFAVLLLALGLVVFWVDRLGIRPILELTRAAEELADARSESRVEVRAPSTEAGRLGLSFNKMLDARQAADDQQRRFVADASHELRTPLTTLQGYSALHARGALTTDEKVDDAMRRIGAEAKRMSHLVDELLTLASLDEGRPLSLTDVDLSMLLADVASDAAAIQPDRHITTAIADDLRIKADPELLTEALTTTIRNALRHTPASAGLAVRAVRHGPHVRVDIADRGPGIDPAHLVHIFDRFYRSDKDRGRGGGGTGLGLAIAKSITEAHDGTIRVTSLANTGTTIVYTFPVEGPQEVSS